MVVTYNSAPLIADLVASLPAGFGDVPYHLVFADNASSDATVETIRRLAPEATVVEMGRNAGYAAGINAGVAAAPPHTAVLVLNPDVRLTPGCVPALLAALREPGVGIAVPRLHDGSGKLILSMRREPTVLRILGDALFGASRVGRFALFGEVVSDPARYDEPAITDWAEGSTQLISAECFARTGGWDESFFLYSEETDFGLRARDLGFATRYTPTALAIHLEGESRVSPGLWALLTLNRVRLYRRRHGLVGTCAFWAVLLLREGTRALLGRRASQAAVRALLSPTRLREAPGPHVLQVA